MEAEVEKQTRTKSAIDFKRPPNGEPKIVIQNLKTVMVFRTLTILLLSSLLLESFPNSSGRVQALRITNFYVPPYVPITLPTNGRLASNSAEQQLDLAKPILFDCDYDYKPDEDAKLTVRWFRNKEPEPFYQWLPELNARHRHFADWIKPFVNETFVSDPYDPLKRYRSILIKRLSMNLTGQYSCMVSSLAGQDVRQSSLIVYQPPSSFSFEQRIFPLAAAPALLHRKHLDQSHHQEQKMIKQDAAAGSSKLAGGLAHEQASSSPTQFKGWNQPTLIVRPANNHNVMAAANLSQLANPPANSSTKIVYTHDGRPIRRKSRRQSSPQISDWMLQRKLQSKLPGELNDLSPSSISASHKMEEGIEVGSSSFEKKELRSSQTISNQQFNFQQPSQKFAIQLHHFKCQADQITPRPVMVLTVKRDSDSIAQYLHESSFLSIRPYQVSQADYYHRGHDRPPGQQFARRYDLNPSRLGVQLAGASPTTEANDDDDDEDANDAQPEASKEANKKNDTFTYSRQQLQQFFPPVTLYNITVSATVALNVTLGHLPAPAWPTSGPESALPQYPRPEQLLAGVNTVLPFRRGQRMSFECHLEITGTEYEDVKRININEEEVYQFAEATILQQQKRLRGNELNSQPDIYGASSRFGTNFDSSTAIKSVDNLNLSLIISLLILTFFLIN